MLEFQYHANDRGSPLTDLDLNRAIIGGVSHIYASGVEPYKMQWRLTGFGGSAVENPNDVPVSFLMADSDLPIDDQLLVATITEFNRITASTIPASAARSLVKEANDSFARLRRGEPNYIPSWLASSTILTCDPENETKGKYALRVDLQEWSDEGSKIMVYFVFIPRDREVDFSKVTGGGFSR